MKYIYNPKTIESGIITCIPQKGRCPNKCEDCFFQSGRSYLEPLLENLPQVPSKEIANGRIIRINDGNDSNNQRKLVEKVAKKYKDYFYNTSMYYKLEEFNAPVVLTINPAELTDTDFKRVNPIPKNLMFIRYRTNMWNVHILDEVIKFYTKKEVPVIITFMAYYTETIPKEHQQYYEWKKRTLNSYWCLKKEAAKAIMSSYEENPYVYSCGIKGQYFCKFCGNCIREYYNTKERMRDK
jgi:hypothetical protein